MIDKIAELFKDEFGTKPVIVAKVFTDLFKKLNIQYEQVGDNDDATAYRFEYQGEVFVAVAPKTSNYNARVLMPDILSVDNDYYQVVSYLINDMNRDLSPEANASFIFEEKENKYVADVVCPIFFVGSIEKDRQTFTELLSFMFEYRRIFYEKYENLEEVYDKNKKRDIFEDSERSRRTAYLILEHEMMVGEQTEMGDGKFRHFKLTPKDIFTIPSYIVEESAIEEISMTRVHQSILNLTKDDYGTFDVADYLRRNRKEEKAKNEEKRGSDYFLSITQSDGSVYSAYFVWQSESKVSDYYKLVVSVPSAVEKKYRERESAMGYEAIYVVDKSETNNSAEVRYMIEDANDKINAGKAEELTDVQRSLIDFIGWSVSNDIYWGLKYFHNGSYLQAIKHLECVTEVWRSHIGEFGEKQMNVAMEVYFKLGYAYASLKIYSKALYYLEFTYVMGSINGSREYINCLVITDDWRAMSTIDRQLELVLDRLPNDDDEDGDDDVNEKLYDYRDFLYRSKVRLMVCKPSLWDDAEKLLKELMESEDEDMKTFAQEETALLADLKKQKEESDKKAEQEKQEKKEHS